MNCALSGAFFLGVHASGRVVYFVDHMTEFDTCPCDMADFGDYSGISSLIEEVGLPIAEAEYHFSYEQFSVPEMSHIA